MSRLRLALYHNLHSGGAKRVVAEHLTRLSEQHDVTLFTLSIADQQFASNELVRTIPTVVQECSLAPYLRSPFGRLNPIIGLVNLARLDALARRTAERIDASGYDVALVHPCQITQAPLLLRWLRTPSLYYLQELPRRLYEPAISRPYLRRNFWRRILDRVDPLERVIRAKLRSVDRQSAWSASLIACNSKYTGMQVMMAYKRQAVVCYQGVDGKAFRPAISDRRRFILSVGALTPAKGFDFIIEALGTLPKADRAPLVLVSNYAESDERTYIEGLADRYAVDLDIRVGVSDAELQQLYAQAACVAYAPVREPFGLVALEAMASGAALVAVAEGGITESVIHGETGLLAPREPHTFGAAIARMLANSEESKQLGQRARQYVLERWDWKRHIAHLEELLCSIARKSCFTEVEVNQ